MTGIEVAVALYAGIDDATVDPRANLKPSRPVLRREGRLQPREVLVLHTDEAALGHRGPTAYRVLPREVPRERPVPQVQLEAVLADVRALSVEPLPAGQ